MKTLMMIIIMIVKALNHGIKKMYVDLDGTVISGKIDMEFREKGMEWYMREGWRKVNGLRVNKKRLIAIRVARIVGIEVIGWTNRFEQQRDITVESLGIWGGVFSEIRMYGGEKKNSNVSDGIVIDNEEKYVKMGAMGIVAQNWIK